jgi:hypothetical protein
LEVLVMKLMAVARWQHMLVVFKLVESPANRWPQGLAILVIKL